MKLTEAQQKIINRFIELENEHGKGNVFLRYINDFWKIRFIVHKPGAKTFTTICNGDKINGKIVNSMDKKGLLICCDSLHNEGVDPNGWRNYPEGVYCVGSRIKIE